VVVRRYHWPAADGLLAPRPPAHTFPLTTTARWCALCISLRSRAASLPHLLTTTVLTERSVDLAETTEFLRRAIPFSPRAVVVLGSGLGAFAERIEDPVVVPFAGIPGFPVATVAGHAGRLVAGHLDGEPIVAMQGRFHLYEGWSAAETVRPLRALAALGPRILVVTNAAGGARSGLGAGELMLIEDHINFMFHNPLVGPVVPGDQRFPDMSEPYDPHFRRTALAVAEEMDVRLSTGVYAAVLGPSYETPAEIRMLARLGADAVGMSTVPEVIAARAMGLRVLGISCITNAAAGLGNGPLSHDEVLAVGAEAGERLTALLGRLLPRILSSTDRG
jgi:purine-nucleoside phosphorylase